MAFPHLIDIQITPFPGGIGCWSVGDCSSPLGNRPSENLGGEIRRLRHASGYSQEALADMVGVDESQIRVLEHGDNSMSVHHLRLVAIALGAKLSDVLAGAGF